jgi:hypothetical protein
MLAPPLSSFRCLGRRSSRGLLLVGYLAASLPARAGNDDEIFVGNQAAMTGGAVSATVSDSSATWYNPAGLGSVGLAEIDLSGTCYTLRAYSAPRFIASADGQTDSASVVEFVSVPAQIAYVRRLGPGLSGAQSVATSADASAAGRIQAQLADPSVRSTHLDVIRAGRLNLGLARLGDEGDWVSAEVDIQPGIDAASAGVQRRAVVNARLGVYHRWSETMAIGAGLFTDRSPDRSSSEALSGPGDFYGGSLGWQHDSQHRLGPGEPSDTLSLSTTLALRYAFSRGHLNDLFVDPSAPENLVSQRGPLLVHELGLYVGGGLSF